MAITVSSPDAFLDDEDWTFGITVHQPDGTTPLDLTGSRLFARFCDPALASVGVSDSAAPGNSLVIASGGTGATTFTLVAAGRTWKAPRYGIQSFAKPTIVTGDLYRYPPGGGDPQAVCRIQFPVLPSTGLPS